jgi:hypothetical protein
VPVGANYRRGRCVGCWFCWFSSPLRCWVKPHRQLPKLLCPHIHGASSPSRAGSVAATTRLGNNASMTQGRSAGFAFRVRITVDHRLPNMLGQKRWGKALPTTVGQRLAITLGQRKEAEGRISAIDLDVGDLDRVVQVGARPSFASFLQRKLTWPGMDPPFRWPDCLRAWTATFSSASFPIPMA